MEKVYIICMVVGIAFPLIALIFDFFDSCTDMAFDALDLDLGTDFDICFLPLSVNAVCMASLLFGGFGLLFRNIPLTQRNIIGGVIAYVGAVLIQSLLKYLKKSPSYIENEEELKDRVCTVSNKIALCGYGSIACEKAGSTTINLTAKEESGLTLEQGTLVEVLDIIDHVAIVRKKTEN